LFTTPVIYLAFDRLQVRLSRAFPDAADDTERPAP
jgi:hypothetical protein